MVLSRISAPKRAAVYLPYLLIVEHQHSSETMSRVPTVFNYLLPLLLVVFVVVEQILDSGRHTRTSPSRMFYGSFNRRTALRNPIMYHDTHAASFMSIMAIIHALYSTARSMRNM